MAKANSSTGLQVESIVYPPSAKPPGATNTLFLGGTGVRGLDIEGKFVKFSGIGVYLEYKAISLLAVKWKGKSVEELTDSVEFYRDIVTGGGKLSSDLEVTRELYKADAKTIDKFLEISKDQNFPPGSSVLFTISLLGSLTITFSKDPEAWDVVIEDGKLGEAILESQIGKHGVSPATKKSLASRLYNLMNQKANDH